MGWELLAARVAVALKRGQASESLISQRLGMEVLPSEFLRAALLHLLRKGAVTREGIEWRLVTAGIECGKCHDVKHPDQFHNNRHRPNGKQPWCKKCMCRVVSELYQRKKQQRLVVDRRPRMEESAHV